MRGFLGIAGFMRAIDVQAVGQRLAGKGAYLVIGATTTSSARRGPLQRPRLARPRFARYYEVPDAPHALRPLDATIARAWNDMLTGVTKLDDDGLGIVRERLPG